MGDVIASFLYRFLISFIPLATGLILGRTVADSGIY
jgi:hypothetical protein